MAAMHRLDHRAMILALCFDSRFPSGYSFNAGRSPMFRLAGYDVLVMEGLLNLIPFVLAGQLVIAGGDFLCCHVLEFCVAVYTTKMGARRDSPMSGGFCDRKRNKTPPMQSLIIGCKSIHKNADKPESGDAFP